MHFGVVRRMSLLELARADDQDRLDVYVEAQVHGPVLLARDVEALVLDPCFRGTEVEAQARELICPVEWHDGFRLGIEELVRHPKYRGVEFVALGLQLARDGYLDARIIGQPRQPAGTTRSRSNESGTSLHGLADRESGPTR
jgi:hypothetical protein